MIFLPIADRELRVAARKRSTFWVRLIAAVVAFIIGAGVLILQMAGGMFLTTTALGKVLFGVLTWLSLGGVLLAGVFFTSDCVSEEKREGTIGFLFLTELRGYDVVLGKLLATSLRAFLTLFGIFPILGITLMMGGVTGAEFWKTSLALTNGLFLSLAAGLFVSAISRDPQRAMGGTLCLLTALSAIGPSLYSIISPGAFRPFLSVSSPVFAFVSAGWSGRTPFWLALLVNHIIAWGFLALSCLLLPRTWQEKATKRSEAQENWERRWKLGSTAYRTTLRAKWIAVNPVSWLASRERSQKALLWILALLLGAGLAGMMAANQTALWFSWGYLTNIVMLVLYLVVASQSGRFFVEAQRSRLIELLLATPLSVTDIVQGHWRAMLRTFGWPLALCAAIQLAATTLAQYRTYQQMGAAVAAMPTAGAATNSNVVVITSSVVTVSGSISGTNTTTSTGSMSLPGAWLALANGISTSLTMLANVAALCWFGMWMGLNSKNTNLATLKTILFVQVVPWFVISFAAGITVSLVMMPIMFRRSASFGPSSFIWFPLISAAVGTALYLIKDCFFVVWSRRQLLTRFRDCATQANSPAVLPPRLPPAPAPIV